tara:strand:- start:1221 stop:1847 length:627 start_codon:yes stop_codon:yes gene_type:complete
MMKYAYFNPLVMAVEDVDAGVFSQLKQTVQDAHTHTEHNDAGNPNISVRGGQQIQIVPNEFKLDTDYLKNYIETKAREYIDNIVKVTGVSDLNGYDPHLISAWTIKQSADEYQALHNHEAHISGNIYIDFPELDEDSNVSDGCLEFRFPVIRNPAHFIFNDSWKFKPAPMKMVMFPSYVAHTVYPWKGKGNRTILAWDAKLLSKTPNK